ncbi:efflux RND transporter periplasmic adaptor subunit [Fluoribacter dumoffii]|uniref:Inner membrane protein yibH n=1 Tax=Fluoribacter dumoffii TaxID=463 RepID=A0A377GD60_9GAMM|nr:efflux RND transporter periplasmic adaptor subunit [Fluoribacter dumoffii]KTC90826.1 multidrug efflux system [Fluoribacter dumoffii NY 23]MCW8386670.1 efflux RND transporter periplasmic adaptor subunit [Fluoribacter dumoffii]MCW8419725.1 efflux RND transporter periplasmic adaptor subunit [Fluoribacter dumoffii]MCW8455572.1 efflux RND transporter periplasmic adaptor subunit [Fluoribacter dumoffii]MCW8460348.1 efflux RND transporter periplasmic adaptor subunit [Fluoribacter dumoffii]
MAENKETDSKSQEKGVSPQTLHKRKIAMFLLGGIFLFAALLWFLYWLIWGRFELYTDDAYVTGNMVQLMPQIPGTVISINADDTQLVMEGQILIKLDPTDYKVALQRAKADLAQTVRQVRQYFENAAQAQQNVIVNKANLVKAQLDLQRRKGLVGNRAVSREEMQHYKTAFESAKATYDLSQHQLDAALALVENSHLYTHPLVETAKANLKTAYLNFKRTTIVAPITGYVAKRSVQPGQQVSMNSAMMAIVPLSDTWVDANYKESGLNDIRIGQPVTLYADAYPGMTYHGRVVGLNAGTGSAFALLPPQNATGNWIKIVQRLPVRISLNPEELKKIPLQLGLSMRVTIDIHNLKGNRIPQKTEPKFSYQTKVYRKQLAEVESIIEKILHANSPDMYLPRKNNNG